MGWNQQRLCETPSPPDQAEVNETDMSACHASDRGPLIGHKLDTGCTAQWSKGVLFPKAKPSNTKPTAVHQIHFYTVVR